jgi:hypothetical protein
VDQLLLHGYPADHQGEGCQLLSDSQKEQGSSLLESLSRGLVSLSGQVQEDSGGSNEAHQLDIHEEQEPPSLQ